MLIVCISFFFFFFFFCRCCLRLLFPSPVFIYLIFVPCFSFNIATPIAVAIKESIDVKGLWTGLGRKHISGIDEPATRDDTIVARFRAAGAIIVGVTTMTEFGTTPLVRSHLHVFNLSLNLFPTSAIDRATTRTTKNRSMRTTRATTAAGPVPARPWPWPLA